MRYQKMIFLGLSVMIILFSNIACTKDSNNKTMNYFGDFTIQAGLSTFQTHVFPIYNILSDTSHFFSINNTNSNKIKTINSLRMRLVSLDPGTDYSFINGIVVYIVNPDDPSDYQEIFYRENVPFNNGDQLDLFPSLPNIKKWLYMDRFDISVEMILRQPSPQFIDTRLDFAFEINE